MFRLSKKKRYEIVTRLNTNGLRNSFNSKLFEKQQQLVEMITTGGFSVEGKVSKLGLDYVDIRHKDSIVTVLKDKIILVKDSAVG